jgi:hypothetical protein
VDRPARFIQDTISPSCRVEEWATDETGIRDVSTALITTDPSETVSLMAKYDSNYLITDINDAYGIFYAFVRGAGKDTEITIQ